MRSNDLTNSKKTEIQAAMQKALQNNDAEGAAAAFDQMLEYVADAVRQDYEDLRNEQDARVLAARGVRQLTSEEMNNGVSELDALHNFAQRCSVKEIRKFTSILSQNIQKGGSELTMSLRYMNEESWEEKKQRAKRKGETAGTKLMIPLIIMFVGILFMIIVPIFSNML